VPTEHTHAVETFSATTDSV